MQGQGSPATAITSETPGHPRWTPHSVRVPNPPAAIVQLPPAIMERSPAPGIIGGPVPAAIGVDPMTAVAIGAPSAINDHGAWLPAPAEAFQLHPGAVRRKVIVKIGDILWRIGIDRLRLLDGWRQRRSHWLLARQGRSGNRSLSPQCCV